ncbi:hypothetical protein HDU76_013230 [Blyttiomyces sp. JEL0837]|nr:hypothetical protein HDU76_013230 [Blyttiomyces sp. JEL0837]
MRLPKSMPKEMPNDWVLKQIAFPPHPSEFQPTRTADGLIRPPKISYRNQERIRKACLLAGLDPIKTVGLPEPVSHRQLWWEKNVKPNIARLNNTEGMDVSARASSLMGTRSSPFGQPIQVLSMEERTKIFKANSQSLIKMPKGYKRDIDNAKRDLKVQENIESGKLDERLQAWREVVSTVADFYGNINPATLSGAIDIVVVQQESGELSCSPFHVRFGKLKLLRPVEKKVLISINGEPTDLVMKVGEAGEAFFVVKTERPVPSEYATSPLTTPGSIPDDITVEPLNLGESVTINIEGPTDGADQSGTQTEPGIVSNISGKPRAGPKSDTDIDYSIANPAASPPNQWSWTWGGLPVKAEPSAGTGQAAATIGSTEQQTWDKESVAESTVATTAMAVQGSEAPSVAGRGDMLYPDSLPKGPVISSLTRALREQASITPEYNSRSNDSLVTMTMSEKVGSYLAHLPQEVDSMDGTSVIPGGLDSTLSAENDSNEDKEDNAKSGAEKAANDEPWPISAESESPKATQPVHLKTVTAPTAEDLLRIEFSLCGRAPLQALLLAAENNAAPADSKASLSPAPAAAALFAKHQVSYDVFVTNPDVLMDPALVVKVGDNYHDWLTVAPMLASFAAFGKPLPNEALQKVSATGAGASGSATVAAKESETKRYSSFQNLRYWWSRGSSHANDEAISAAAAASGGSVSKAVLSTSPLSTGTGVMGGGDAGSGLSSSLGATKIITEVESSGTTTTAASPEKKSAASSQGYVKSLRLNSDQLKALKLKKGMNTVTFSVTSTLQGTATCTSKIFFWDYDTKVVISDVDGTITKSDVLGHVFTMVGRDWTHAGVASLYTNIRKNGYQILYLTSRAIGQSNYTRDYLNKVEQQSNKLPDGPVIMSPDRLFTAFHREVIQRKPEEFKIQCLRDIKRLFGEEVKPFYAGFGNRITDALSYRSVDVPNSRIFTIDPSGEVKLELISSYKSSYVKLNDIVDQIFPPVTPGGSFPNDTFKVVAGAAIDGSGARKRGSGRRGRRGGRGRGGASRLRMVDANTSPPISPDDEEVRPDSAVTSGEGEGGALGDGDVDGDVDAEGEGEFYEELDEEEYDDEEYEDGEFDEDGEFEDGEDMLEEEEGGEEEIDEEARRIADLAARVQEVQKEPFYS